MQQPIQPPQSHFIWQPILLLAVIAYLIAELYFLTAMVNTFDAGIRSSDFTVMEHMGRFISGAGIGLSVIIGLSMNCKMYQFGRGQRIAINTLIFTLCTLLGYFAVKSLYEVLQSNVSKPIVHCSVLGNSAIRALDRGELPGFEEYGKNDAKNIGNSLGNTRANNLGNKSTIQHNWFSRQLLRLYLPLHVCLNDDYRRILQASEVISNELRAMVKETHLPERLAKPAVQIYTGFREQLPRFSAEIANMDALNKDALKPHRNQSQNIQSQSEEMFALRKTLITRLESQLKSQSRYTNSDVERIVAVYVCALDTAIVKAKEHAREQRFMLAVTDCLYDRARARFKTLPDVEEGIDIYALEDAIANDWARQFILSPQHMPEKALELMRQSFALVFLPTYAVFISTFVVFMCLAAYFRTRFLIRAAKTNKRVNPVINAMLSPLVVVPGIWTVIFLWVPEPNIEAKLFPPQTQNDWVKVIKVTVRPLFHYYEYTHGGFSNLRVPLLIAPKNDTARQRLLKRTERDKDPKLENLKGYYVGEICLSHCEPVMLDLENGNVEFAQVRYPLRDCDNRLVYDKNTQSNVTFYESSKNQIDCPVIGVWQVNALEYGLLVVVDSNGIKQQTVLKNLHI